MLKLHSFILIICNIIMIVSGIFELIGPGKTEDDYMSCLDIVDRSIRAGSGIMSMILGVFGICAAIFEKKILKWTYLLILVIVSIVLVISSVYGSITFRKITEEQTMEENPLKYFPRQVQEVFIGGDKWNKLKECYISTHACYKIKNAFQQFYEGHGVMWHYSQKASLIKVGCCQHPLSCLSQRKNSTSLKKPGGENRDCEYWEKSDDGMCFDCDSCKAGHLGGVMESIDAANGQNIITIIFLVLLSAYTYSTLKHDNENDNQQNYWKQPSQSLPIYR